ncbi:MAG: HlyD family efflux transporter periplasmic adaptor subunit [Roseomonas sp.]|nr:HlyD family efflux transporter periplasmic adaptor subunit [Roseomonas sp.]
MNRLRMAVLAATGVVLGLGLIQGPSASVGGPAPTPTAPAVPSRVALGRIEPASDVIMLAAPQGSRAGRIAELLVREGDVAEAGQAVALMDNVQVLVAQVRQAEATLTQREARLAQRLVELEAEEASLASALEQERANRDRAKWEHERMTRLRQGGVYRDTALIDKRLALDSAEQKVIAAELALARARVRDAEGRRLEEAVLRSEVEMARASASQMQAEHEMATLRAPSHGTVLRINTRPGEVPGSDGIMLLGDLRRMRVRAEVFETDLPGIRPGQPVQVASRALPQPLAGSVEAIGLRVARQTIVREDPAATLDARVVEVMVALDARSSALAAGLTGLQVRAFFGAVP